MPRRTRKSRSPVAILPLLSAALLGLAACGGPAATSAGGDAATPQPTLAAGDAARGEAAYAQLGCKGCHGAKGEKDTAGPDLFAVQWGDHRRQLARETILNGKLDHKPPMPSYKGKVDDAKIADLLAYFAQK